MTMNLIDPFKFGTVPPVAPPTLVFGEGWHTLAGPFAVPDAPLNSSGTTVAGRYTSPNSSAARITGSGTRRLPITVSPMSGDWMVLGFNARWEADAQGVIIAINRGAVGGIGQDANTCARFRAETNGDMTVLDSTGATVGSFSGVVNAAWHWFDVKINAVGSGEISVWMDNTPVINNAAGDFAGASATGNTWGVIFTDDHDAGSDNTSSTFIGETLIGYGDADTAMWGEHRGYVLIPNGIDTAGSFTANSGTLATATDELFHDDDTTYATTNVTDDEFLLTHADVPGGVGPAMAVKQTGLVRRTTGSSSVEMAIKSGAQATLYRSSVALSTNYVARAHIYQNNPATSQPWTEAELNALKSGAKMTGSGDLRITNSIIQALVPV